MCFSIRPFFSKFTFKQIFFFFYQVFFFLSYQVADSVFRQYKK